MLDRVKDLKVLVVGDSIADEYFYVKPVGKSTKEPVISSALLRMERFHGGVRAAANHLKTFCAQVDVMTGPVITVNRRYVEETYKRKLFTVHYEERGKAEDHDPKDYDLVIVTDFGHGYMTEERIALLYKSRFLAINAQTNSQNYGFNLITKYPRADLVVVDELEARLAAQDNHSPIEDVILKLGFKRIIVTMGAKGAVGFDGAFERQPASANAVIDTMGAGDAFLCVSAPFAAVGCSMKDVVRIGNAAGAAKVKILGHTRSVTRDDLEAELCS